MFKIGNRVFFLVEQNNRDITLEDGRLISHDEEGICLLTTAGVVDKDIFFIPKENAFHNVDEAIDQHNRVLKEIDESRKSIKRIHASYFEKKN